MRLRLMPYPGDKAGPFTFTHYTTHKRTGVLLLNCEAKDKDTELTTYHTMTSEAWMLLVQQAQEEHDNTKR